MFFVTSACARRTGQPRAWSLGDVSAEHCLQCEAGELAGVTRARLAVTPASSHASPARARRLRLRLSFFCTLLLDAKLAFTDSMVYGDASSMHSCARLVVLTLYVLAGAVGWMHRGSGRQHAWRARALRCSAVAAPLSCAILASCELPYHHACGGRRAKVTNADRPG
jgi:hypothetical protein